MNCVSPIMVNNNGTRNNVPCGRCGYCLSNKRNDWSLRLQNELKVSDTAYFLTMTYDDACIVYGGSEKPTLVKKDFQDFMKRLRKKNEKISKKKIRFYGVGEYGTKTNRPHYHAIVYNASPLVIAKVDSIWGLGNTLVGDVTPASIHYVTKYIINNERLEEDIEKPFRLCHAGPAWVPTIWQHIQNGIKQIKQIMLK